MRKRVIVIDMKQASPPPPVFEEPREHPACARPQGLPPTLKATLGDLLKKRR